ncbi:MAG: hypothetical protein HY402_04545 [Elusimicrobia bacterium]|nr:hypothetical protein [Elusimicrobiota bacterium]
MLRSGTKRQDYCLDCFWCETSIGFDAGSNYVCTKKKERLTSPVLWRLACEGYLSLEGKAR